MLTIILAESELELIPEEIAMHPSVITHAKRRGKRSRTLLLDSSLHHTAMKDLSDRKRRGRPDLVHTFLLVSLESILNLDGQLRVLVHTRDDKLLRFDPSIRLPKNYNRFVGLIEQLYEAKSVPAQITPETETPLIKLEEDRKLKDIISELKKEAKRNKKRLRTVVMADSGKKIPLSSYFQAAYDSSEDVLCIIGGFPEGDYHTDYNDIKPDDVISIHDALLKTWTVASEVIVHFRASTSGSQSGKNEGGGEN